jgi:predicted DNA-binding transcriptional regulator YafY
MAALPPELRSRATRLVERFHLDAAGWFQADEPVPHLATLAGAVWDGRQIDVIYRRGEDIVERRLAPLGLVLKGGVWYLVALSDDQIRTYRGSRITEATVLEERTERPADFDLATYWAESSAAYERQSATVDVVVRIPEERLVRLRDVVGAATVSAAERIAVDDPEGWLHLRVRLRWPDEVPARLLAVGSGFEVIEPLDIREGLIATAARVLERYRVAGPTGPRTVH